MKRSSANDWRKNIKFYAILMITTVVLLSTSTLVFVLYNQVNNEKILKTQDEYHLSNALAASSSRLEATRALRNIEAILDANQLLSIERRQNLLSDIRSSLHILQVETERISLLQEKYADSNYSSLVLRLEMLDAILKQQQVQSTTASPEHTRLAGMLVEFQTTLEQFQRLHVIGYDELNQIHLAHTRQERWQLSLVLFSLILLSSLAILRGFSAISSITIEQEIIETSLRESENRFRDYAVASADRYWHTDSRLKWQWTDVELKSGEVDDGPVDPTPPNNSLQFVDQLRPKLEAREIIKHFEIEEIDETQQHRWWQVSGVPINDETGEFRGYRGVATEFTEQKVATEQSRRLQRIDAIGRLTGGIAHDFNNLLFVILGNLELLQRTSNKQRRADLIEAAIAATHRGSELNKNLLSFARRASLAPRHIELNKVILTTKNWAARVLPESIEIETSLLAGLWSVKLDPVSLESALLNLFLNARDAMPNGGKLTVETANCRIDDEYILARGENLDPGRYVLLAITDTGHGIVQKDLEKIFEPFFTTKAVGEGSGLGLSMVEGFVRQSGGAIRVYSELEVGTTFKVYFKASNAAAESSFVEAIPQPSLSHNDSRILLVEDDSQVMNVLEQILLDAGYSVTTATNGAEALKTFKHQNNFDLVVTDIVMPGDLQGPKLAKKIRAENSDIPFVFLSGYPNEATVHGNGLRHEDVRLMKPVRRIELLEAVAKLLPKNNKD